MPRQVKAVLFDYGNVISQPQGRAEVAAMAAILNSPIDRFQEVYWADRLAIDRAAITPEAYWDAIGSRLSHPFTETERQRITELDNLSWSYPDPIMLDWAAALRRAGMKTGILSNMPITVRAHLRACCEWLPVFDHSCYSCDVRLAKPEPEIFLQTLAGLGEAPGDVLFLDDREENIDAALALGIQSIRYRSPEQAQCEIDQHYHLPEPILRQGDSRVREFRSPSSS
jgi:putative hydrolase of the HAD superfamily